MEELKSTLIQHSHPRMRKKNASLIDSFLKQTFANSFLTFIEAQNQLSERPTLKQSEEMIQLHYKKLHSIIDSIDQHLTRRLQNHENEVFALVKDEIEQMRAQTQQIVQKLNNAIKEKNIEDEIWQLSNQLDYFKSQTYKLFQENRKLREDMKIIKNQLKESEIELQNSDRVMQKLKHSCMKAKLNRNKVSQNVKQKMSEVKQSASAQQKSITAFSKPKNLKTDYSEFKDPKNFQDSQIGLQHPKQSIVNINTSLKIGQLKPFTINIDQNDPLNHQFSFENSSLLRTSSDNGLPKVNMIKVISQMSQQLMSNDQKLKKHKQVQTEPIASFFYQKHQQPKKVEQVFSKTSCIDYAFANQHKQKQIDLLKSGFYMKTFNERSKSKHKVGLANSNSKRDTQMSRYMNNTFNRNKIINQKDYKIRVKTINS